jgi:hypothetical protein
MANWSHQQRKLTATHVWRQSKANGSWLNDNKETYRWSWHTKKCISFENNSTILVCIQHSLQYTQLCSVYHADRPCTVHDVYTEDGNYIACSKCPHCTHGYATTRCGILTCTYLKMSASMVTTKCNSVTKSSMSHSQPFRTSSFTCSTTKKSQGVHVWLLYTTI